jgi:hypothetical protein
MALENYKPAAQPVLNQPNQRLALYLKDQFGKISNSIGSIIQQLDATIAALMPFGASGPSHSTERVKKRPVVPRSSFSSRSTASRGTNASLRSTKGVQ